jgi:hypothetical protein
LNGRLTLPRFLWQLKVFVQPEAETPETEGTGSRKKLQKEFYIKKRGSF